MHVAAAAVGGIARTATDADKWRAITRDDSKEWQDEMSRIKQEWPGFREQHEAKLTGVLIGVGSANVDRRHYAVHASAKHQKQIFATVRALQQRFTLQQDAIPQRHVAAIATPQPQGSKQPTPALSHPNQRPRQSSTATTTQPRSDASGRHIAMPASSVAAQRVGSGRPDNSPTTALCVVQEQQPSHSVQQLMPHSVSAPQPPLIVGQHNLSHGGANVYSTAPPLRHSASAAAASGGALPNVDVRPGNDGWQGLMDGIRQKWPGFTMQHEANLELIRVCRRGSGRNAGKFPRDHTDVVMLPNMMSFAPSERKKIEVFFWTQKNRGFFLETKK
jgi:hypothetical protein